MRRLAWLVLATARAAPDTDTLLARAAALARWANRTGPAPPSWTVTGPKDVTVGHEVHAGKIKKVSRGTTKADLGGASIIIKTIEHGENGTLLMELLFLHALRGAPGVPELYGGWRTEHGLVWVVQHAGEIIGQGKDRAGRLSILSDAYAAACRDRPLQIARAWFRCLHSIVEGGFVLTDFKIDQFTFDGDSLCDIVLVSLHARSCYSN